MKAQVGTKVEVDAETLRILTSRKPLLRLLTAIEKHREISTRRLLELFGGNDLHKELKRAESEGFVRRERAANNNKKGHVGQPPILNYLTPEGLKVVETARALGLVV